MSAHKSVWPYRKTPLPLSISDCWIFLSNTGALGYFSFLFSWSYHIKYKDQNPYSRGEIWSFFGIFKGSIMYALTYDLEYIMRYIVRVILSNNCTRRSRVQLFDKMTRTIYLIMYERSYVNVFNTRSEYRYWDFYCSRVPLLRILITVLYRVHYGQ